jgi:hypothetical protein
MEVENDLVKYWFEDGILFNEFKEPFTMDLENIKKIVSLRHQISNGEKKYWVYDVRKVRSMTKEARDYAEVYGQDYLYATAVIVNSHITMFLFNIFVKIKTPTVSLKVFKTSDKAVEWLKELKSKTKD